MYVSYYDGLSADACIEVVAHGREWCNIVAAKRYVAKKKRESGIVVHMHKHVQYTPIPRRRTVYIGMGSIDGGITKPLYAKL